MTTPEDPFDAPPLAYGAPPPGHAPQAPGGYGAQIGYPGYGAMPIREDYASWGQRVSATLIDALIVAVPVVILVLVGTAIGGAGGAVLIILAYLVALGFGIWNQIIRQGSTGQTIGKERMNIKLIGETTGEVIGAGPTFLRGICHIVDSAACYIGWLWPLWDDRRQTFADKIMSTVVITV